MIKRLLICASIVLLSACGSNSKVSKEFSYDTGKSGPGNIYRPSYSKGTLSENQKNEIVMLSFSLLNTKYNWGGKRPDFGLDCSGLVSYVFKRSIGVELTGAARHIVQKGQDVPLSHAKNNLLQPGDLIYFNTTGESYSHVGIYIGEKKFLHASSGKKQVIVSKLDNPYFSKRIERIKRI